MVTNKKKMKTAEEILKKNCHIEKHPNAENQTVVYSHIDSVLVTMQEYARLQIEKDREYFINKIAYLEATHPGELVGIRMRYEARPITLT